MAALWFLSGHLIESTVIDLELYFEHRNDAPSIGLTMAVGMAAVAAAGKLRRIVPAAIASGRHARVQHLASGAALGKPGRKAAVWLAEHPNSARAHQQLADQHFRAGRVLDAREVLQSGLGTSPANFSLSILLIDCTTQRPLDRTIYDAALRALRTDLPNPGTAHALRDLRVAIADSAPLSGHARLGSMACTIRRSNVQPKAEQSSEGFIRLERSAAFAARRDLGATMREIELAYAQSPEPEMALYAAQMLPPQGCTLMRRNGLSAAARSP